MKGEVLRTQIHLLCLDENNSKAEEFLTTVLTQSKRLVDAAELDQYFPNERQMSTHKIIIL